MRIKGQERKQKHVLPWERDNKNGHRCVRVCECVCVKVGERGV